jgi:hypothetical protein
MTISQLSREMFPDKHGVTKVIEYYDVYEKYFAELRDKPINLVEIGVFRGESIKTFGRYFSKGRVLGLDIEDRGIDLTGYDNVRFKLADQTNHAMLRSVIGEFAPNGLDIAIDDASHIGAFSLETFRAVFPLVKIGGLYIVEDWSTGYWDNWADGSRFQPFPAQNFDRNIPKRLPSHDFGMVGFVKMLVDLVAGEDIRPDIQAPIRRKSPFAHLHLYRGLAVIRKAGELNDLI